MQTLRKLQRTSISFDIFGRSRHPQVLHILDLSGRVEELDLEVATPVHHDRPCSTIRLSQNVGKGRSDDFAHVRNITFTFERIFWTFCNDEHFFNIE